MDVASLSQLAREHQHLGEALDSMNQLVTRRTIPCLGRSEHVVAMSRRLFVIPGDPGGVIELIRLNQPQVLAGSGD